MTMSIRAIEEAGRRAAAGAYSRVLTTRERGDMPGWVLIAVMTAVIVVGLLAVAGPLLEGAFRDAVNSVTSNIR